MIKNKPNRERIEINISGIAGPDTKDGIIKRKREKLSFQKISIDRLSIVV